MKTAQLYFEDGTKFIGQVFAQGQDCSGEVIFNTAMSGYQEVLTDPSYFGQMVLMTYPLIGNYGINDEDVESRKIFLKALLVKEYIDFPSNWRSQKSLKQYLEEHNTLGIEGFDTRAITRYLRSKGSQKAILDTTNSSETELIKKLNNVPSIAGKDSVKEVTCSSSYVFTEGYEVKNKYKIAVIDCGIKYNILRHLIKLGCECTVFPASVKASEILNSNFDGVFLSNGPGDPEPVTYVVKTIEQLLGKLPIFGICLGNQLLGLALGGKTYKLKFGHHGINHPVKQLKTGHIEITSQNHNFCLDIDSLDKNDIEVTHINLNDNTVEGFRHKKLSAFAVQYHPEAAPGPHDSSYLFKDFISLINNSKK
jgi:carbamoyl-phosphate synthase small subunit